MLELFAANKGNQKCILDNLWNAKSGAFFEKLKFTGEKFLNSQNFCTL